MANERPALFTVEFWQNTITNAVYAFASGALGPLVANQANLIHSVPWYAAVSSGGIGMAIVFLGSIASLQIPNRVPGSFIKETDEEARMEKLILREERLALERQRLREKEEMDRHRAPEPERQRPPDDFIVTGIPPERRPPPQPPPQMMSPNPPQRPPQRQPRQYEPQNISDIPEHELPYVERESAPRYETPDPQPRQVPPKSPAPQENMEQWPQGGRRGKQNRGE